MPNDIQSHASPITSWLTMNASERLAALAALPPTAIDPHLFAERERLRAQHIEQLDIAERYGAAVARAEAQRAAAAIERITLPEHGTADHALLVVTGGVGLVAAFERDGKRVEIQSRAAVGFIPLALWTEPGVEQQVRTVAAREMAQRTGVLFEPGAARADLLSRIPTDRELPAMSTPRIQRIGILAETLPLIPLVAGWFRVALDSHDENAPTFCRVLRRRFGEADLVSMLEQPSAAAE